MTRLQKAIFLGRSARDLAPSQVPIATTGLWRVAWVAQSQRVQGPRWTSSRFLWQGRRWSDPTTIQNHSRRVAERTWRDSAQSGATVDRCDARSDAQYELGEGEIRPFSTRLNHGIKPGFSVDNANAYSSDSSPRLRLA